MSNNINKDSKANESDPCDLPHFCHEWSSEELGSVLNYVLMAKEKVRGEIAEWEQEFMISIEKCLKSEVNDERVKLRNEDVIAELLAIALDSSLYDARTRAVIYGVGELLEMEPEQILLVEKLTAQRIFFTVAAQKDKLINKVELQDVGKITRWALTGAGALIGAAVLGISGGMAAPLIAAGMCSLGLGAEIFSSVVIASLFGIAGGGLTGAKVAKRLGGLSEFAFLPLPRDPNLPVIPSLHASILVPGFLYSRDDITGVFEKSFASCANYHDVYSLAYDPDILIQLGSSFEKFMQQQALRFAGYQAVKQTALGPVTAALTLPLTLASLIDNPWVLAVDRATKAGTELANILSERIQGKRPVTLIGYSVGALAIFECLKLLASRQCYGLIDSVVLLGAPVASSDPEPWLLAAKAVSRRFINVYSRNDWILSFLFRVQSMNTQVAGLSRVKGTHGAVKSIDLTLTVNGHLGYRDKMAAILEQVM